MKKYKESMDTTKKIKAEIEYMMQMDKQLSRQLGDMNNETITKFSLQESIAKI